MKGVVLAGGSGSRLYPITNIFSKQLQPVYDKPMIYYPLSLLMLCGIREIMIISTPRDLPFFKELLGDGQQFGVEITFQEQLAPKGIAEAFILGEKFINNDDVMLVLGDNLFYGNFTNFRNAAAKQIEKKAGNHAHIFAYQVRDPERYGVLEFDKKSQKVLSIEEKPIKPKSNWAIPGLYLFDSSCSKRSKDQKPSLRGELEITDLIKSYLSEGKLGFETINRGMAWFDTGTPQSLLEASSFIGAIEQRQGMKVACLEEIALRAKFMTTSEYQKIISKIPSCDYRRYLEQILKEVEISL